jgi:hypothetical protein
MKISLFEIAKQLSEIDFEFRSHVEMLLPILQNLDSTKISEKSGIEFDGSHLILEIIPLYYDYAGLDVYVGHSQLIISFAEKEQYENHHENNADNIDLETIDKYLSGIIIKEYVDKNGKVIKRKYFYKDNTEIGGPLFFPFFAFKTTEKVISISFKKGTV